jgi:hypothetical protein
MKIRMLQDLEARAEIGTKNYPQYYGPCEPTLTEQPEIRPSIWFTEQKQYCHQRFISNQPEWHSLMKKIRMN